MTKAFPEQFGDYELLERIGVGGMAETFVAVRRGAGELEQRVCIKRILPSLADDPEFVQMFLREARLSALLHHGNIARLLDFGAVRGAHYLALELVEGTDLRTLLRHARRHAKPVDIGLVAFIAHALASALDFAHTADEHGEPAGIVHRDISPSNVLLSWSGEVKLADFGIAKAMNRPGSVQSNVLKGKVAYMAPEYAVGRHCSARSDLFSLGVLLYECLAGFRPFDGGHDLQTIDHARHGRRDALLDVAPRVPARFAEIVEALLQPEPERRPPNAGALRDLLEDVPPPPLARRHLGRLVRSIDPGTLGTSMPGLASTRPAPTRRPRKRLPSRK